MKFLIAVDGSAYSSRACREVVALARELRKSPQVTLFNVDAPLSNSVAIRLGSAQAKQYHKENAEAALKPARSILKRAGVAWSEETRIGEAGSAIADFAASSKYDLIVMGSHGRTALRNLVMGSVATKVIANSSVPVLVVR
jgi:nucleotide-binding universal stress UspA family protein